ncbi:hypothetical protein AB6A40_002115 [Gnathostoma spinigerum]|uniref:Uncharacterized protein n=1 Tax=Gnathostoma spinigerum TaxID=75299 RepID=A0ABD6E895_9BILA
MTSADGRINPRLTHRETQRGRLGSTSQQSSSPTNSSRHRDIFRRLVESVAETDRNLSGLLELAIRQDDEDKQEVDGEVDGTEEVEAAWPPRSTDRADQLIYASSAQASLRNAVSERDDESGRRRVRSLRNLPNDITLTELESELPRNSQYSDCPLTSSQPLNSEQVRNAICFPP